MTSHPCVPFYLCQVVPVSSFICVKLSWCRVDHVQLSCVELPVSSCPDTLSDIERLFRKLDMR